MSLVCSMVLLMSSSKREILTDWESACERESLVLRVRVSLSGASLLGFGARAKSRGVHSHV